MAAAVLVLAAVLPVDSVLAEDSFDIGPGSVPLTSAARFENPLFTDATADAADPWGIGWDPDKRASAQLPAEQGRVDRIFRAGDYVYIGGNFHRVRRSDGTYDENARHLVRVRWDTGELDTSWAPTLHGAGLDEAGRVWDFATFVPRDRVRRLLVVGDFTAVDGNTENAKYLAVFKLNDPEPPVLDTTMFSVANLDFNDRVHAVGYEFDGTKHVFYLGGYFTFVATPLGTRARQHLVKVKLTQGSLVLDNNWRPTLDTTDGTSNYRWVSRIAPVPGYDRVVIGGQFTSVNDRGPDSEKYLAAVDKTGGTVQPWADPFNSTPDGKIQINATEAVADFPLFDMVLVDEGGTPMLYSAHGARNLGAKWNALTGERLWYWWANGDVQAVTYLYGKVYFGFHGDWVTPGKEGLKWGRLTVLRRGLWVVSADGSTLDPYGPAFRGEPNSTEGALKVWALLGDGRLYVGGDFLTVDDQPVEKFAVF